MKSLISLLTVLCTFLLIGCGGGGGAATGVQLTGLVLELRTGSGPTPSATVQAGNATVQTAADGSFTVNAPSGTSFVLVTSPLAGGGTTTFRFDFAPATTDRDLGDLYVGPEKIRVTGRVLGSADSAPLSGATVSIGGKSALTNASGVFDISDVAFDSTSTFTFLNLTGLAGRAGFFTRSFNPTAGPSSGVATIDDIFLQPDTGDAPPDTPFVITGTVSPSAEAPDSIVELFEGTTLVRRFTVGSNRQYGFWVPPGTYTLRARKGSLNSGDISIVLTSPAQIIRRDVTLQ